MGRSNIPLIIGAENYPSQPPTDNSRYTQGNVEAEVQRAKKHQTELSPPKVTTPVVISTLQYNCSGPSIPNPSTSPQWRLALALCQL
jgi:hypothetical protein